VFINSANMQNVIYW